MKHTDLYTRCEAALPEFIDFWRTIVNIDTGSRYGEGINQMAQIVAAAFEELGAAVTKIPCQNPQDGTHVLVQFKGSGKGKLLAMAHMDTVFTPGTAAERPFTIDGEWVRGPGVSDCKGSVALALFTMKQLCAMDFHDYDTLTFFFNCDEEIGSPDSHDLLQTLAKEHHAALCMEPGQVGDGVVMWRKGSANLIVEVTGVESHAGSNPENGRNALVELTYQIQKLMTLENPDKQTTVNFTVCSSGCKTNVIPNYAKAIADVRVMYSEELDRLEAEAQTLAATTTVPDTTVRVTLKRDNPPFGKNEGTDKLIAILQTLYKELDKDLIAIGAGGASDANWAATAGITAVDGLGPVKGGKNHTAQECTRLDSVVPRMYLMARTLMTLGHNPNL